MKSSRFLFLIAALSLLSACGLFTEKAGLYVEAEESRLIHIWESDNGYRYRLIDLEGWSNKAGEARVLEDYQWGRPSPGGVAELQVNGETFRAFKLGSGPQYIDRTIEEFMFWDNPRLSSARLRTDDYFDSRLGLPAEVQEILDPSKISENRIAGSGILPPDFYLSIYGRYRLETYLGTQGSRRLEPLSLDRGYKGFDDDNGLFVIDSPFWNIGWTTVGMMGDRSFSPGRFAYTDGVATYRTYLSEPGGLGDILRINVIFDGTNLFIRTRGIAYERQYHFVKVE